MTAQEQVDANLDAVLKASGSALKYNTMQAGLDRMREAMRKVMSDSYIAGSNDCAKAILSNEDQTMKLKVKKTHPNAMLPVYASAGAACFDLHAADLVRGSGKTAVYDTGLAFEIPEGYAIKVYSRSGHGFKHNIRLANGTGIIDSDYRGSVMVKLTADGVMPPAFAAGDRIAQAELVKVLQVGFEEVDELSSTERGAGGFGSTGS